MKLSVLFVCLSICLFGCGADPNWVGVWRGGEATLWLESNGRFHSEEVPLAQSKPSGTTILRGSWSVEKTLIRLYVSEKAIASRSGMEESSESANFTTDLSIGPGKKSLTCHQIHLYPLPGSGASYSFSLRK